ncbi:bifunctional 3,4-dihydroxy-2-butanone 4-phosphate synthase/GTP cyclohydrolase II [Serinicoccus sp. CUA-874]|uniref:3,4-dihydroxy-2-butanone-4-phosphate synthase n=1 Tax=Serinicoccus sp. CUA-874 TaxID=1517939 RepID=UPI000966CEA4|nr:3,4-dihydroxy-2-butanone-4-phosphate synthase [Serinicoccus sp. CUA-874]OLT15584.1 bifunctional 3,4-dihydroxy-2-butanone 4-phosphate synthase/GTP cyclohydrolase II [Serinicoccus sp. CUA-874]
MSAVAAVPRALDALRSGRPVLVLDDEDREDEGDVVLAAQTLTPGWTGWAVRHTSGFLCAPMPGAWADRLGLPAMVADAANEDELRTAYTVTVDATTGVTTGISAADRCRTAQVLADERSTNADLRRPGHLVPLRARDGGVLARRGHTEATVDLCRLAGLAPVGVIGELVDDEGEMLRGPQVRALAAEHDLPVLTIAELVTYRQRHDRVQRVASSTLPTEHGELVVHGYRDLVTGVDHLALLGRPDPGPSPLVRVHSECLTGEALGSRRCDCGPQLQDALARVAVEGGAVVYLRGHEGRGVGLVDKLRAYAAQDGGLDTVAAQEALGLPVDARDYSVAAAILEDLGQAGRPLRLLTHNPDKVSALTDLGLVVAQTLPSGRPAPAEAQAYLRTKVERLGHSPHLTTPTHETRSTA